MPTTSRTRAWTCRGPAPRSASAAKAEAAGLVVKAIDDAVKGADVVMVLAPDEHQAVLYVRSSSPTSRKAYALAFAHGFAIHYNQIVPART